MIKVSIRAKLMGKVEMRRRTIQIAILTLNLLLSPRMRAKTRMKQKARVKTKPSRKERASRRQTKIKRWTLVGPVTLRRIRIRTESREIACTATVVNECLLITLKISLS